MVTRFIGHYETGVYDVRTGTPRPTLLAPVLEALGHGRKPDLPQIAGPGWWRRPSRLIHAAAMADPEYEILPGEAPPTGVCPLMIVADEGELARLAIRSCEARGLYYVRCTREIEATLTAARPWAVFDARDRDGLCGRRSRAGGQSIADISVHHEIPLAFVSGAEEWHRVDDRAGILEIRTGSMFMPWDSSARAVAMLDALDNGGPIDVDAGAPWTRVYGPDVVDVLLDLLLDGVTGAVNAKSGERVMEAEFARGLAAVAYCDPAQVRPFGAPPPAPLFDWKPPVSYLPPLETTLERLVRESRAARLTGDLAVERRDDDVRLEAAE
jgi:dTDP-4-dehydrorhamnose reductase